MVKFEVKDMKKMRQEWEDKQGIFEQWKIEIPDSLKTDTKWKEKVLKAWRETGAFVYRDTTRDQTIEILKKYNFLLKEYLPKNYHELLDGSAELFVEKHYPKI